LADLRAPSGRSELLARACRHRNSATAQCRLCTTGRKSADKERCGTAESESPPDRPARPPFAPTRRGEWDARAGREPLSPHLYKLAVALLRILPETESADGAASGQRHTMAKRSKLALRSPVAVIV
jgi:hypothetical protein